MRGEVEIWDGDKLLHKENNLLVNGAGELLADIMTVSPSLSGIADHATSSILDASNYTIQAISFGKDASAYQYNAHALDSRRNLLYYSTPSDQGSHSWDGIYWDTSIMEVCSAPEILPPTQYENVPSSVAHALSVVDTSVESNASLNVGLGGHTSSWTTSGGQDNWFCASVYLKSPDTDNPFSPYPFTSTVDQNQPHWKLQILGDYYVNLGGFQKARSSTDVRWSSPDFTTPSSVRIGFYTDQRGASGYSIDNWDEGAGIEEAGNGWYRAWTSVLSPVSALSAVNTYLHPVGYESAPTGETSGGIYAYGYQLELGRWPTQLQFNQGFFVDNWDLSGSVLNRDHSPGAVTDKGTVRVVPPYGTSSYVPTNYLSSPPNPDSTRVEDGDTALFDTSSPLSGFNMGQNLNVIPYREQGSELPNFFNAYTNYVEGGTQFNDWLIAAYGDGIESISFSGIGSIGPQAYYLGCYPEGSSTGGSNWALVSSLDNSAAYPINYAASSDPNFVSGTYNSIVNEASSMDVSGFVNMIMSSVPNTVIDMSSTASGLCLSAKSTFATDGIVEYSMLLGSGDVGYSNLYGGIYNMGLWTIDMDKTLKAGNTPPYSFGPLNNPRKYKLFSTKHLTKNLGFIEDNATAAGALNYTDLTIKWRLHFL